MFRSAAFVGLTALMALAPLSCSPPEPPTITVKEAKVTEVDLRGMNVSVLVLATNKNRFDLTLSTFEGKILLGGRDAGTVSLVRPITLTQGVGTPLSVPLSLTWTDTLAIAAAAASGRDVPYTVDGSAGIGGGKLSVRIPIKMQGTIPQKDLKQAAQKSLQNLPFALPH